MLLMMASSHNIDADAEDDCDGDADDDSDDS